VDGDAFEPPPTVFGATKATIPIHPIRRMPPDALTPQLGVPGPWHERMPHFRMDHTPSAGDELQTEYLLPRRLAADALRALAGIRDRIAPVLMISEVRTVAADELWMIPLSGDRRWRSFHVAAGLGRRPPGPARDESALARSARPHWGK
jgi:xylitol oxidase